MLSPSTVTRAVTLKVEMTVAAFFLGAPRPKSLGRPARGAEPLITVTCDPYTRQACQGVGAAWVTSQLRSGGLFGARSLDDLKT